MIAALLLSLALFQPGQQPPQQQTSPQMGTPKALTDEKAEKCVIEGKIVSSVDGQPLKKAIVTLLPQPQPGVISRPLVTNTDADGKFLFREVDAARYTLNISRNGYARTNYGARVPNGPGTTLSLVAGQHLKDINARLIPAAALNGRIIDEDNDPVSGVFVQLQRWGYVAGKRQLVPYGGATTDDRGQFRVHSVTPGRYYVSATYEQNGMMFFNQEANPKDQEETYVPTYYPGVFDIAQANAVDLKAGDDIIGITFRLMRAKAVRVSGVVRGPDGPVRSAMIQIFPRGVPFFGRMTMRTTDERGVFTFTGIMPGAYVLSARGGMAEQQQMAGRAEVDVAGSPIDNVNIDMTSGYDFEAAVHLDGAVDLSKITARLILVPQEMSFSPTGSAQVKDAGSVTLSKVYDGNYNVRVAPLPDDAYVSKVVYDDKDALSEGLKVRGGPAGALEITINADGARVDGTVQDKDHQPFTGAFIALVPEEGKRSRQDLFKTATSDQYGHFTLRGVTPGKYKLFAWDAVDQGAYMDPDFLKSYEDEGKTMELSPGEKTSPELRVIVTKSGA